MQRVGLSTFMLVLAILLGLPPSAWARDDAAEGAETLSIEGEVERAVLYTISPGSEVFERWGHTLLCFQPANAFSGEEDAKSKEVFDREELMDTSCFDFGIFPRLPLSRVVFGSLRGEPLFVPQRLDYQNIVGRYWLLDRTVERQILPLRPEQVFDLLDRLDQLVREGQGYAYHPYSNNCSTQVRDIIDEVSGGKLSRDGGQSEGSLRKIAERGFSGHALALAGVELLVGASADQPTTSFERAAFPKGLRDLISQRMGAPSTIVYQQSWEALPTSVHAGRLLLIFATLGLSSALWFTRRSSATKEGAWRKWATFACLSLSGIGTLGLALALISDYPEFSSSWTPVVFLPLDATVPWMKERVRKRYLQVRIGGLTLLGLLSLLSVIAQPLLFQVLLVGFPLTVILFVEGRRKGAGAFVQQKTGGAASATESVLCGNPRA